jgi:hypothetical protein
MGSTADDEDMVLVEQLLTMMTSSISYLTQRTDFKQVDPEVPLTKSRPKDKVDPPKVFGGRHSPSSLRNALVDGFGVVACRE